MTTIAKDILPEQLPSVCAVADAILDIMDSAIDHGITPEAIVLAVAGAMAAALEHVPEQAISEILPDGSILAATCTQPIAGLGDSKMH